jgi:hypothetical protein
MLFFTSLLFSCNILQAQEEKIVKHEVGTNTAIFLESLFNSHGAPFNFMYKSASSPNSAFRLGASYNVFSISNKDVNSPLSSTSRDISFCISFGKEFLVPVTNRWMVYYGADVMPDFGSGKNQNFNLAVLRSRKSTVTLGAEVRPFLGLRFNISERLYISSEASIYLRMAQTKERNQTFGGTGETLTDNTSNKNLIASGIRPLSGIYLFYRF